MSLNKTIIQLRIGKDCETGTAGNGQSYAKTSGAYTEKWKDKQNEKHEKTQWYNLIVWGKNSENFAKYVTKGKEIIVEGVFKSNEAEKDGTKTTYWSLDVSQFHFTSGSPNTGKDGDNAPKNESGSSLPSGSEPDDEIPF